MEEKQKSRAGVKILLIGCVLLVAYLFKYFFCLPFTLSYQSSVNLTLVVVLFIAWILSGEVGKGFLATLGLCVLTYLVMWMASSPVFHAEDYANRITVETGDFDEDIPKISDLKKIPLMDTDTAAVLGSRAIGELTDVVSQYNLDAGDYATIVLNGDVVKVAPLQHASFWKWYKNKSAGIPGYVIVNPKSSEAEYVKLEQPIRYSPSAWFGDNIMIYARKHYPSEIFGNLVFQVDEEGDPYWTIMTYENLRGWGCASVNGLITIHAVTGEHHKYKIDELPDWIEQAVDGDTALFLYNAYATLKNGWWNRKFAQEGCAVATSNFGYLQNGNDICIYTGVTSVNSDSSNLGFLIVNTRTGKFKYYKSPGADESSAMAAAYGAMQNYGYQASFPSLVNINGDPVYAMAMKDTNGLVKAYAFVNAKNYSVVGTGSTLSEALNAYRQTMRKNGYDMSEFIKEDDLVEVEEQVTAISFVPIKDETYTYITCASGNAYRQLFINAHAFISPDKEETSKVRVKYEATSQAEDGVRDAVITPVK